LPLKLEPARLVPGSDGHHNGQSLCRRSELGPAKKLAGSALQ
jgi:hypothetical protein